MTELRLIERGSPNPPRRPPPANWRILVVDDDPAVHAVTNLALKNLQFQGRGLDILVAQSAAEAREILAREKNIAVVLLDVVMETESAGLDLVSYIREDLGNANIRIILRTGQPGQAPEDEVIFQYDINDYKTKTELTVQKLFSSTVTALRTYERLRFLDEQRLGLQQILEACDTLYEEHSLQLFARGVLAQLGSFLKVGDKGILCVQLSDQGRIKVLGAGASYLKAPSLEWRALPIAGEVRELILLTFERRETLYSAEHSLLYINQGKEPGIVAYLHCAPPEEPISELVELFCKKISSGFRNLSVFENLRENNAELRHHLETAKQRLASLERLT